MASEACVPFAWLPGTERAYLARASVQGPARVWWLAGGLADDSGRAGFLRQVSGRRRPVCAHQTPRLQSPPANTTHNGIKNTLRNNSC